MSRDINSLMHDVLRGMVDKKNLGEKNKSSDDRIFVDWETFNKLEPI